MYHNPEDQESILSSDFDELEFDFSPEELMLLQMLAKDRIKFMKQDDDQDSDTTVSNTL